MSPFFAEFPGTALLASEDADGKLACFCTAPALSSHSAGVFCEVLGTFCLILPIFLIRNVKISWPIGTKRMRP